MVSIDSMNKQVNVRLPEKMLVSAKNYAKKNGFSTVQEFIKETLREKLFEEKKHKIIESLEKIKGTAKTKTSNKRLREIREQVSEEYFKEHGL